MPSALPSTKPSTRISARPLEKLSAKLSEQLSEPDERVPRLLKSRKIAWASLVFRLMPVYPHAPNKPPSEEVREWGLLSRGQ